MPFLNAERFIGEAIESIFAQTYSNWELVLVDDGSTDSSTRIALAYVVKHPDRVSYVDHEGHRNRGISAARNTGVRHSKGKYVAFLDADDVWLPHKLQSQVAILESRPQAAMLWGRTQYWSSWTGRPEDRRRDFVPDHGVAADTLYDPPSLLLALYPLGEATAPSMSNLMTRRELIEKTGGFEEDFRGMFEDQAFLAKAYLQGSALLSNEQWDRYRLHPGSCSSAAARTGEEHTIRLAFLNWFDTYLRQQDNQDEAIRNALQRALQADMCPREVHYDGWVFRVGGANQARLVVSETEPEILRIIIDRADLSETYDIQLNHPNFTVQANRSYRVVCRARADRPRPVSLGVAMAHPPWDGLGMYRKLELTPEWQHFDEEFVAWADEDNARLHFDLGGSDISVEVAAVNLLMVDGAPASATVQFGDLRRVTPISREWGYDRGQPIDRHYTENFVRRHAGDIRGRVLEIQENTYTRRFGGSRVTRSDVLHVTEGNPQATIVADLTNAPQIPSDSFDCIVLTQTLQHIFDVRATIRTLHRILKPGGVALATVPGISRNNDSENDWYWLFTALSARRLFEEAFADADIAIEYSGNVLSATSFLYGLSAGELTREELEYTEKGYEVTIGVRAVKGVILE